VGTPEGLKRFQDGRYTRVWKTTEGLQTDVIGSLKEDPEGRLWIGCIEDSGRRSWQRLEPVTGKLISLGDLLGGDIGQVGALLPEETGRLWLATADELLWWENARLSRVTNSGAWNRWYGIGHWTSAGSGVLWFAPDRTGELVRFEGGRFEHFGTADGLADTDFRSLLWDREGNLWVGTGSSGLQEIRPRTLTSLLTTNTRGARQQIDSAASGRNGVVWLSTWTSLLRWQNGFVRSYTNVIPWVGLLLDYAYDLSARAVLEDRKGQVWFGARDRGLFTLAGDQVVPVPAADLGRTNWTVRVLHEVRAGTLWIGSDSGLLAKRGECFVRFTTRDGLLADEILGIQDAPDGSVWIGTGKGINQYCDGRFRSITMRDGLVGEQATPLLIEQDGTVWVSSSQGLNRIRGHEIRSITEQQGLWDNAPFCLLDDGAGNYWANSVRGIFQMHKANLHAVAEGRQERLFCVGYGEADGAASAEGSGGYQPNACRTPDGRMWFATTRGVVVLDPTKAIPKSVPPPVLVEEVKADDRLVFADGLPTAESRPTHSPAAQVRLPEAKARLMEIHYTANSFIAPEKIRFHYRLEGIDSRWREVGA
jgi:ligand-binding sensor domain-containing protein